MLRDQSALLNWGLRDYGSAGQLGLEPTPEEYVSNLVDVFREVRRVLRKDGTLWLNLGDCYATDAGATIRGEHCGKNIASADLRQPNRTIAGAGRSRGPRPGQYLDRPVDRYLQVGAVRQENRVPILGLKPKDLVGIPWRVAFALQADGWWLRSEIAWVKDNPMPESVTDRPSSVHEKVFLLAKSERYYYDAAALREPSESGPSDMRKMEQSLPRFGGKHKELLDPLSKASALTNIGRKRAVGSPNGRNGRNVWRVNTVAYPGAHFATFPPELPRRCILAGSRPGDLVLDPFGGSGTTAKVALELGRRPVHIDLKYHDLARKRCRTTPAMAELMR